MLLEDAKVAVNLQAKDGATLLFGACKRSHTKVVSLLLRHEQINVNLQTKDDFTPLCTASQKEGHDAKVVPMLSQHEQTQTNVNLQTEGSATKLFFGRKSCQGGILVAAAGTFRCQPLDQGWCDPAVRGTGLSKWSCQGGIFVVTA